MSSARTYNVLFLCTGNSARSIMAESILNHEGGGRFRAFSAGSHPKGKVDPHAIRMLEIARLPTEGLHSKGWDAFAGPDAPRLDFVFTVCDAAAGEVCPVWPGQPMTAHWGFPDPAAFQGIEKDRMMVFADVFRGLRMRIGIFTNLRLEALDRISLKHEVDRIGQTSIEMPSFPSPKEG